MTGSKDKPNNTGSKRAPASRKRTEPARPDELAHAARRLHLQIGAVIRKFEAAQSGGNSAQDAWLQAISNVDRSVIGAVMEYAERVTLERARVRRALRLARVALKLARGNIGAEQAIQQAARHRGDGLLPTEGYEYEKKVGELKSAIEPTKNERRRWEEAYKVLAWDADVWATPERARGRSEQVSAIRNAAEVSRWLKETSEEELETEWKRYQAELAAEQ